ncbi:IS66 family transposase [Bradyrhizobium sp. SZCCHNRI1003]|uniref:IS66 family transposase n=1 Tax=Bradyrhizobium sp. SZCCHNRI1003 TaxID=3057275 RepID=UPI002916BC8A|nr:IS66 family transposase [Bradyrhizobium sp. SZCCHNRI1003]
MITADSLPDDVATLKALVLAGQAALSDATTAQLAAEAKARNLEAEVRARTLLIEQMKFTIAKLKHEQYGPSSERASVLEQLELELADLEEDASEAEAEAHLAAERAKAAKVDVSPFERRRPARRPLPEHLPRERIVHPAPAHCPCCGGDRLRKIGEDVTETLELVPRQWKVIQHVREKFSCRACEAISQPPAPFHPISRGRAGPRLLAHILFAKYGLHLPLNRQSTTYAHEGVTLDVSTLADWVGAAAATLMPLVEVIKAHVLAGERLHADDTTVPVLAKGKTRTGRVWTYVRDDRPFAGHAPPAAMFFYSPNRTGAHPETHLAGYAGPMQADAYAGFDRLYEAARKPGPIIEVGCWAHARRKFFEIARLKKAPIAIEAIAKIDALFAIEREINGLPPHERKAVRHARSRPLVDELHAFLRERRAKLSGKSETAKAIDYSLKRWQVFTRFIDDGRLCMTNNAAERELRAVAVGRKNWTFAGSDEGGRRASAIYTLIQTAKLNDVDPQAWLADVLARLPDHPASRIADLLPWNWKHPAIPAAA